MPSLTTRRVVPRLTSFICLFLFLTGAMNIRSLAQDLDEITLGGRVTDADGAVVVGAKIVATLTATGASRAVSTDAEGRYRLVELAPGTYSVRASCEGFAVEERTGLAAVAGRGVRLDFTLRPAGVAAEQTVAAETSAPAVDTSRTVTGGTLARREIEELPVFTRSPLDLVFTLPGVTEEPLSVRDAAEDREVNSRSAARKSPTPEEAGTFALAGGAAYSNNLTVDGLDNNDDRAARERFQPSLEAVEEVQVITNQFSAEYGRASGGRVNLRTRAGSNQFRGRAFYFFRDEALNANTFFNNARGLSRLPLQQHDPGFTLGGRLIPKRTFFFTSYEYDTTLDSTLIDTLVPVASNPLFTLPHPTTLAGRRAERTSSAESAPADLAPFVARVSTPQRSHALTARLDHNFSEAHNGAWLYQLGRFKNLRQFGGGSRLAESLQGRTRDTDALAYTDNFVLGARAVNQLRAQVSRLAPASKTDAASRPVVLITINDPLSSDDPSNRSGTLVAGSANAGASDRRETRAQLQDTLTLLRGAHTLKVGGDLQLVRSTFADLTDATGTFSFASAADFLAGAPSRFRQRFRTESRQRNLYTGVFVQDEWRVRPNLVISFGLRHDDETILRDRNNFAPRLAAAYDPFGTGKTVVRLGVGIFYSRALLRTVDDFTLGQNRLVFDTDDLRDSFTGRALTDTQRRAFIASHLRFPETLDTEAPLVRQFAAPQTDFTRRLDPSLRIPESYQMNVGFEREISRGFVFEANYTFNRGIHLWREFNANAPRLPRGFRDFADYLLSRDFPNLRDAAGTRPLYDAQTAGDLVRFTLAPASAANPDAIGRVVEFGVPVTLINLNSFGSTTALQAALAALANLRPDPSRTQIEQLVSAGNSFYHGLTVEARTRLAPRARGFGLSLRAGYTLSRLVDDGVVNTSSALRVGDFRGERAPSLLDRRHRFALSATLDAPRRLGSLRLSAVMRLSSGAPFNVSLGGDDRNLDDVGNDRPSFSGDLNLIRWRAPGSAAVDPALLASFSLPTIGRTGNLPRNAGTGPALFTLDLSLTREFRFNERARLRPVVEIDNVLNKTVFTFGAEFINFSALRPDAAPAQRQSFLGSFLAPTRTLRPRSIRVGVRFDF
ncbi:MAG: TonB-dependent receptor [Acidobacteria bacterium]|nr:TonB-dependent receptor [Acidobacteriota bacterium]